MSIRMKKTSIYHLLITKVFLILSTTAWSQDDNGTALDAIITPDLERREITEAQLDSENWEIGVFGGIFSIEDFGTNTLTGVRAAFHMTEDFAIEFNYGVTQAKESSIEVLGGGITLLSDEQRQYSYYNASIIYNILPGEVFIGSKTAFNNAFYLSLGAGNTTFSENDYFTIVFGGGMRFYATDAFALHATVKDHIYNNDIIESKTTNNIETSLGLSFYF